MVSVSVVPVQRHDCDGYKEHVALQRLVILEGLGVNDDSLGMLNYRWSSSPHQNNMVQDHSG
jgi:hypothetical protein